LAHRQAVSRYGVTMIRILIAAISIAGLSAAGCATQSDASSACVAAFRNAVPRAGAPYNASPLDDAVRACRSVAAWRDAWTEVPEVHASLADPLAYLEQRCAVEKLAPTELCRDLATQE